MDNSSGRNAIPLSTLIVGTVVFVVTLIAWLYAVGHGIDPAPLWLLAGPVIGGLFLSNAIGKAADNAQQAAIQTNGQMDARIRSAVSQVFAEHQTTAMAALNPGVPTFPQLTQQNATEETAREEHS